MLVRPIKMKPARRSRETTGASASASGESSSAREPARVTWPLMSNKSLIENGMPAKGDGAALTSRSRSIALAASIAASTSTCTKARAPSPDLSAILARHSSTSLRALVRPLSRSAARLVSVGISGMVVVLVDRLKSIRNRIDLQIEQGRAQRFAMRIQRERARHATPQRPAHHEVQRKNFGQLVADDLAFDDAGEMRFHPLTRHLRQQQRIMFLVIGDDRDIRDISLVAGTGMSDLAQFHLSPDKLHLRLRQLSRQQHGRNGHDIARRFESAASARRTIGVERFDLVADADSLAQVFGAAGHAHAHLIGLVGMGRD